MQRKSGIKILCFIYWLCIGFNLTAQTNGKWWQRYPVIYEGLGFEIFEYSEGLAKVVWEGKAGFIDGDMNIVIPLEYTDNAYVSHPDGRLEVIYDKVHFGGTYKFITNRAIVKRRSLYGVIDSSEGEIIPFDYQYIQRRFDKYFYVKQPINTATMNGYREGYLSLDGEVVVPVEFLWVTHPFNTEAELLDFAAKISKRDSIEATVPVSRQQAIDSASAYGYYFQNHWIKPPVVELDVAKKKWTITSEKMAVRTTDMWIEKDVYVMTIDTRTGKILQKTVQPMRYVPDKF